MDTSRLDWMRRWLVWKVGRLEELRQSAQTAQGAEVGEERVREELGQRLQAARPTPGPNKAHAPTTPTRRATTFNFLTLQIRLLQFHAGGEGTGFNILESRERA